MFALKIFQGRFIFVYEEKAALSILLAFRILA